MCAVGRKVLIQEEARKNKSRRKKYFVLTCCENYTRPRLDYFASLEKWTQHKDDIYIDNPLDTNTPYRSIDLGKLFFVDDVHRSKPKHGGLDLYLEDGHFTLIFGSDDIKRAWKEIFDNVVYKNGKIYCYPKIEHTLQVGLRFKPKENINKSLLMQLKGDFRACFMKTSLVFVNKSLEQPEFTLEYQFIRKLESRYDGTFRLEIGRAAPIGECHLVMQLSDYAESNAAHAMLINCTKSFKIPLPEPVRIRSSIPKMADRRGSLSSSRAMSVRNSLGGPPRSEVCSGDASSVIGSHTDTVYAFHDVDDSSYMEMNNTTDMNRPTSGSAQNYFEHISRVYQCQLCGSFTKVVTFCSKCTNTSSISSIRLFCQTEGLPQSITSKFLPSHRGKAQSLTERPNLQSPIVANAQQGCCLSELRTTSVVSQTSQSSSKTSTTEMSSSSKLESRNSLSVGSNRRDDEIFAELYFDTSDCGQTRHTTSALTRTTESYEPVKCHNCCHSLVSQHTDSQSSSSAIQHCHKCHKQMVSLTMTINESDCTDYRDWLPRNGASNVARSCNSEYVDTTHNNASSPCIGNYCS